jgi:hypothetical protein
VLSRNELKVLLEEALTITDTKENSTSQQAAQKPPVDGSTSPSWPIYSLSHPDSLESIDDLNPMLMFYK